MIKQKTKRRKRQEKKWIKKKNMTKNDKEYEGDKEEERDDFNKTKMKFWKPCTIIKNMKLKISKKEHIL